MALVTVSCSLLVICFQLTDQQLFALQNLQRGWEENGAAREVSEPEGSLLWCKRIAPAVCPFSPLSLTNFPDRERQKRQCQGKPGHMVTL